MDVRVLGFALETHRDLGLRMQALGLRCEPYFLPGPFHRASGHEVAPSTADACKRDQREPQE